MGPRRNIHRHYDLSNELFALFLDPSMTYSSALFGHGRRRERRPGPADLTDAQHRKIDRLLDLAGVGPARVLEIGTGWGELAIRAAQRGAHVHTVTISEEQATLAQRARRAPPGCGRPDRRRAARLPADRPERGGYDAMLSVEMIEAVGEKYWPTYFATLDRLLAPTAAGSACRRSRCATTGCSPTRNTYTWMHKYVFPGGLIPSVGRSSGRLAHTPCTCPSASISARTTRRHCACGGSGCLNNAQPGRSARLRRRFRRTWGLYLAYSEAGFTTGYLNVGQYVFRGAA